MKRVCKCYKRLCSPCPCTFGLCVPCPSGSSAALRISFELTKIDSRTGDPIAGAAFALMRGSDRVSQSVSDGKGILRFSAAPGRYLLVEQAVPPGYLPVSPLKVLVTRRGAILEGHPAGEGVIGDRPIDYEVAFLKIDEADGLPLPGAQFRLSQGGTTVAEAVSDPSGVVDFGVFPAGGYEFSEILPPEGYMPNPGVVSVTVEPDGLVYFDGVPASEFRFGNRPLAAFGVVKTDLAGVPLPGARFALTRGGRTAEVGVTDERGVAVFSGLETGEYVLEESVPPEGFLPNAQTYSVSVEPDGSVTIDGVPAAFVRIADAPVTGRIFFRKTDSVTGLPVSGGLFLLSQEGRTVAQAGSVDGTVDFGLQRMGRYSIEEREPPAGYLALAEVLSAEVDGEGRAVIERVFAGQFELPDVPEPSFSFLKTDPSGNPLSGAVFTLYFGGDPVATVVTDASGRGSFEGLAVGRYTLKETVPPTGYLTNSAETAVEVFPDGSIEIGGERRTDFAIENIPLVSLRIRKINAFGLPLAGAEFGLGSGGGLSRFERTDSEGLAVFDGLQAGIYTVRETVPPPGYLLNPRGYLVEVAESGRISVNGIVTGVLLAMDFPAFFEVAFRKVDSQSGQPVPGARFELDSGRGFVTEAVSDENGAVDFGTVSAGSYTIREISPAPGYLANSAAVPAVVRPDGSVTIAGLPSGEYTAENTRFPSVFVRKVSEGGLPLAGGVFELRKIGGSVFDAVSDGEGIAEFSAVSPGEYTLAETVPPVGFLPDPRVYPLTVGEDGRVTIGGAVTDTLTAVDVPEGFEVFFTKLGVRSLPLSGAMYRLEQNGATVATAVSDAQGRVQFGIQPAGSYTASEISPPPGYLLKPGSVPVEVSADGRVTFEGIPAEDYRVFDIPNQDLMIRKLGEAGEPLSGAVFRLSGPIVLTQTTDASGRAVFASLPVGSYELTELSAPPGYLPVSPIPVFALPNAEIIAGGVPVRGEYEIPNSPILFDLEGRKVWDDRNDVFDTRPAVTQIGAFRDGIPVQTVMVSSFGDGRFAFENLRKFDSLGEPILYTVREISQIPGYLVSVSGTTVTNILATVPVTVRYAERTTGAELFRNVFSVFYGSDFQTSALGIPGYTALPPTSVSFDRVTKAFEYTFYYVRN